LTAPRARQRFGRDLRLLRARDFERVFERATRSRDEHFTVLARRNDAGRPRLGLAVSRRHLPGAVRRNRVKRLVRESFRRHRETLAPADYVVLARPAADAAANATLLDSLSRHWGRLTQRCEVP